MWLVLTRAPLPDAPYWPGRRLLALFDAVAWPVAWIAVAMHVPQPAGIVGPLIIALAVLSALGRAHRAALQNHRYHFTTWRWGRVALGLLLIGLVLKGCAAAGVIFATTSQESARVTRIRSARWRLPFAPQAPNASTAPRCEKRAPSGKRASYRRIVPSL